MKKRCTNSACRRLFVASPICPHCAKEYPRLNPKTIADEKRSFSTYADVILVDHGISRLRVLLALQRILNFEFSDAKNSIENCPVPVALDIPIERAKEIGLALEAAGATIKIVPHLHVSKRP